MRKLQIVLMAGAVFYVNHLAAEGVDSLSESSRKLLQSEMLALDVGFKQLFTEYYSGDFDKVSTIAKKIERSFVLKQNITEAQKKEIHSVLPSDFIKLDERFHYNAGMLAHAAEMRKIELVAFYFSELSSGCFSCHSQYATAKFKIHKESKDSDHHHH